MASKGPVLMRLNVDSTWDNAKQTRKTGPIQA